MKLFLILLTVVFTINLQAQMWISKTDFNDRKTGARGHTLFAKKSKCEKVKAPDKCFAPKDIRRERIAKVDDLERPNFRSVDSSPVKIDCTDFEDCSGKAMDPNSDGEATDRVCATDASSERWDQLSNWPIVKGLSGPWFIWCQKQDGTFKKKDALVADTAGIAAAIAEDTIRDTEKTSKETKRVGRVSSLMACAKARASSMSVVMQKKCLIDISRELMRAKLKASEL